MARIGAVTKRAVGPAFGRWLTGEMEALGWSHGALAYESNKDHERDSKSPRFTPKAIKQYMSGARPPESKQVKRLVPLLSRRGRRGPSTPYALANSYPGELMRLIAGLHMIDVDAGTKRDIRFDTDKLVAMAAKGSRIVQSLPDLAILEPGSLGPLRQWLRSLHPGLLGLLLAYCYFAERDLSNSKTARAIVLELDRFDEVIEKRYTQALDLAQSAPSKRRAYLWDQATMREAQNIISNFELSEFARHAAIRPLVEFWALTQWPAFVTGFPLTPWVSADEPIWSQTQRLRHI